MKGKKNVVAMVVGEKDCCSLWLLPEGAQCTSSCEFTWHMRRKVGVKTCSRGRIETTTHPSFIMCFGLCYKMRWPEQAAYVPTSLLGPDILKDLVTATKDSVPSWEENWIGSERVPNLWTIQLKIPNFNMWCRHYFQNCV